MSESLLLATNVIIWTVSASNKISKRATMSRSTAVLSVSLVSAWEIVLEHQAGKLRLKTATEEVVNQILYHSPWSILPMSSEHLAAVATLPMLHKDPFDRLLVAQARHEGLTILTADEQIQAYDVQTIW